MRVYKVFSSICLSFDLVIWLLRWGGVGPYTMDRVLDHTTAELARDKTGLMRERVCDRGLAVGVGTSYEVTLRCLDLRCN